MRIYLDTCALNRPFDDEGQARIRLEAEAVSLILEAVHEKGWVFFDSETLRLEAVRTKDFARVVRVREVLSHAGEFIPLDAGIIERGKLLQREGFRAMDALHLATAEKAGADVFLTTDDRLIAKAKTVLEKIKCPVRNPEDWVKEALE